MRPATASTTTMVALLVLASASAVVVVSAVRGFPDMPMGRDGMMPMNAKFGHQRRDRVGRGPGNGGLSGGMHEPPGFTGGPGLGGGDVDMMPSDEYDGSGIDSGSLNPQILARMAQDGEFTLEELQGMLPDMRDMRQSDDPTEGEYIGENGWVRTGQFRKRGDPEPRRVPEAERVGPDDLASQQKGFNTFGDDVGMDERFTGMPTQPSKKKHGKSVATDGSANPEIGSDGRPIAEVDTAQCFRRAIRICPMRLMQDDFAAFTLCIVENRMKMEGSCEGWAETNGDCVADMVKHCSRMDPPDTTRCLLDKKEKLDDFCSKSPFFAAMAEGFDQMEDRMKSADSVFTAAAAGESAAFQNENGPSGGPDMHDAAPSDSQTLDTVEQEGSAPASLNSMDHDEF